MRHRSTAWPLALAVAALVVYASLYPFDGWRWKPGVDGWALLALPWPPYRDRFDEIANLVGYVPLGALLYGAAVRSGSRRTASLLLALLLAATLSFSVEVAQQFLPLRVPSSKDCAFNLAGTLLGALLAMGLQAVGFVDRWHLLRQRWFLADSAGGLLVLLLWPAALLFPAPVALALGHLWSQLHMLLLALLAGTPWADAAASWLGDGLADRDAFSRLEEVLITALGLWAPCLVAYACSQRGWHRLLLVGGALAFGVGVTTLSTMLNFGPQHAFAWWTASTLPGLGLGAALALSSIGARRRLAAALGLLALGLSVTLVAQAPADPYYAASLQAWELGSLIRFHGLAQWIGWLWPFAAMLWLVLRLGGRERE
jgi:VanZ family protein